MSKLRRNFGDGDGSNITEKHVPNSIMLVNDTNSAAHDVEENEPLTGHSSLYTHTQIT